MFVYCLLPSTPHHTEESLFALQSSLLSPWRLEWGSFELRKILAVIKYKGLPVPACASFWQPVLAEQKGEDLILITQISYFILLIKIPDKDLLQHFVALTKLSGEVLVFGLGICVLDFAVHWECCRIPDCSRGRQALLSAVFQALQWNEKFGFYTKPYCLGRVEIVFKNLAQSLTNFECTPISWPLQGLSVPLN